MSRASFSLSFRCLEHHSVSHSGVQSIVQSLLQVSRASFSLSFRCLEHHSVSYSGVKSILQSLIQVSKSIIQYRIQVACQHFMIAGCQSNISLDAVVVPHYKLMIAGCQSSISLDAVVVPHYKQRGDNATLLCRSAHNNKTQHFNFK